MIKIWKKRFIQVNTLDKGGFQFGLNIAYEKYKRLDSNNTNWELYMLISLFKVQIAIGKLLS